MNNHIGLKVFSEVCNRFNLFIEPILIPTRYCQSLVTGANHPQMNYIYDINLKNIEGLADDFSKLTSSNIPMIVLCESNMANPLNDFFQKNGLTFLGTAQSKVRSIENFSYTPADKIEIKEVSTSEMFNAWRKIAASGFGYPKECDEKLFKNFLSPGPHHEFVKLFLGYLDGEPVGQSMLVLGDTLSGNMWSSVLPEYRKNGVLTEMIKHRLNFASKLGFKENVVQCMPMSAPIYDKLGYHNKEILNLYAINNESVEVKNL